MLNGHRWLDCDVAEHPLTLPHMQGSLFCNSKAEDLYIECEATSCTDGLLKCLISGKGGEESAPLSA